MDNCVFCKIADGTLPAEKLYEDDVVVAFRDARPAAPIHVLIVPRKHLPTFNDIPDGDNLLAHIGLVARKIARELGVADSGYRFFINVNRGGGQVVFHLHAHVVAGNDVGTALIKVAVAVAVVWRKIVSLLRGGG
jgi:histidine triad (HIT) family protein